MQFRDFIRSAGRFFGVVLFIFGSLSAVADDLSIIDLRYRTAEEVLPTVKPLAGSAALSGSGYKLFVRGNAADVARIRQVLATLDRAPQQFLVSVRYTGSSQSSGSNLSGGARIGTRDSNLAFGGGGTLQTASDSSISIVRVLEGNGAHIASGQSTPIVTTFMVSGPGRNYGASVGLSTNYRETATGFDVVPRVNGTRVVLQISTQQQRDQGGGTIATQSTSTTVSGEVGDWIDLGGVNGSMTDRRGGVDVAGGTRRIATQSDERSIAVKVDVVAAP